jgi:hypothetical protein
MATNEAGMSMKISGLQKYDRELSYPSMNAAVEHKHVPLSCRD